MTPRPVSSCLSHFRRAALLHGEAGLTDGQLLGDFIAQRDDSAFAALVKRHASMVLGVCRRLIGDEHLAEDALQAVFIVLARRAHSVRPREEIGNWLYGVAYRTALKARGLLARRYSREKQVVAMPHPEVLPREIWHDIQPILDAELALLPDKWRLPIVLCDLEGRSQRDVAQQLKLPPATLANRLASARRRLADRLGKRGIALSGGALAATITAQSAHAQVSPSLIAKAASAGCAVAAGELALKAVSAQALQLSEGVMRMLFLSKLRKAVVCISVVLLICSFGAAAISTAGADEPTPARGNAPALGKSASSKPPGSKLDDKEFLRRICLEMRGTLPTEIETTYFLADRDEHKRSKVVEWLLLESAHSECPGVKPRWKQNKLTAQCAACHQVPFEQQKPGPISWYDPNTGWLRVGYDFEGAVDPASRWAYELVVRDADKPHVHDYFVEFVDQSDESFLKNACQEARGSAPTRLEIEYFKADKDPKKRDKLLDMLLKDPAVAKKLGDGWKKKMLQETSVMTKSTLRTWVRYQRFADSSVSGMQISDRLLQLLDKMLNDKRSDEQVLEALALATLGRLPTESEKKLVIGSIAKQSDKPAAWRDVLKTFATTSEARQHAEELNRGSGKQPAKQ